MALTPCINVFKIDQYTEMCVGCMRYIDEIKIWSILDDEKRLDIMSKLKDRKNESRSTVDLTNPENQ